ncbi:MAG: MFS transporter [Tepidisphaeraceae bacterium]
MRELVIQDQIDDVSALCEAPAIATADTDRRFWTVGTLTYTATGLVSLFCWLLIGDFALSLRDKSVGQLIDKFLLVQGASNTTKHLLTGTIPVTIALILVPIISYRSDRTRSRWGRRIPYLLIPTPIAGLAMIGIAYAPRIGLWLYHITGHVVPPATPVDTAAHAYTLGVFAVLWTIFEVTVIVSGSVFGGLINDIVPPNLLGRFFGLFRAVSLCDGIIFQHFLFKHAANHFSLLFVFIGSIFAVGFVLMCFMVREGRYPPPETTNAGSAVGWRGPIWDYARECFNDRRHVLIFAMLVCGSMMLRPFNEFSYRFSQQLKVSDADYGNLNAIAFAASFVLTLPLGMLVDRFNPVRVTMGAIAFFLLAITCSSVLVVDAHSFKIAFTLLVISAGAYYTCSASLGQRLFPRDNFAQFAAATSVILQLTLLAYSPLMGLVIDVSGKQYILAYYTAAIFSLAALVLIVIIGGASRKDATAKALGYSLANDDG